MRSMRPLMCLSTMWRPSAWQSTNAASRFTASISRHCASLTSSTVSPSCRRGLAQCTKSDTPPSRPIASSARRRAPSAVERSQRMSASSTSAPSTCAPSSLSASAMPRPMPRALPVTSACSPSSNFTSIRPWPASPPAARDSSRSRRRSARAGRARTARSGPAPKTRR